MSETTTYIISTLIFCSGMLVAIGLFVKVMINMFMMKILSGWDVFFISVTLLMLIYLIVGAGYVSVKYPEKFM